MEFPLARTEEWALAQNLSVVSAPQVFDDGVDLVNDRYGTSYNLRPSRLVNNPQPDPCVRIPQVRNLRQRGDEDRMQFIDRVSGNGEHHSHYMKRLTRAELQASGALRDMDNLPTRDSFHPILNREG